MLLHDRPRDAIDGGASRHLRRPLWPVLRREGVGHEYALTLIAAAEESIDQQAGLGQRSEVFDEGAVARFGAGMWIDRFDAERVCKPLALMPQRALYLRARHERRAAAGTPLQTIRGGRLITAAHVPSSFPRDSVTDIEALRCQLPVSSVC